MRSHAVWGVGVVPAGRGRLTNRQHWRPVNTGRNHASTATGERTRYLQAADGHRDRFRPAVTVNQFDVIAVVNPNRWAEIHAVEPPYRGLVTAQKRPVSRLHRQK